MSDTDYDALGRVLTRTAYLAGSSTTAKTIYLYDKAGRTTRQKAQYGDSDYAETVYAPDKAGISGFGGFRGQIPK